MRELIARRTIMEHQNPLLKALLDDRISNLAQP